MATDLGSRLDQGITLPFDWFSDPEIYRSEQRRIFADSWLYAGVADWVAEPGQYMTCRAGMVPVVVVRDEDMNLNAFVNICRHRATEVAQGHGKRMTLQCPYHAWTYGLNGCLRHAPRSEREPGFDPDDYGLLPVGVAEWGPFVFVNRNLDAPPLETYLGRLPQILADAGIDFDRLRYHDRSRVGGGGELEGRGRELPRVLPLPDGAPELLEGDRRRPGLVQPDVGRVVLQPDLTHARGRRAPRAARTTRTARSPRRTSTGCGRRSRSTSSRAGRTWACCASCPLGPGGR